MAGSQFFLIAGTALAGLATVAPGLDRALSPDRVEAVAGYAIPRAPDGQFYVIGKAGDTEIRFLIDPNATEIVLSGADAERLGLDPAAPTPRLPTLAIGPTTQHMVAVRIAPAMPVSLVGRAQISGAEVRGDRMFLR